jgi:acyl-CoA thioester hydrolase
VPEPFELAITAAPADIDELGHVSNLVYMRWVLEVAEAHSVARGWGHAEYKAAGSGFVVRRHEIDYLAQVTAGQHVIARTWVETWKAASCVRRTDILRDDKPVARAATTWAFISFTSGRPQRMPDELVALFR